MFTPTFKAQTSYTNVLDPNAINRIKVGDTITIYRDAVLSPAAERLNTLKRAIDHDFTMQAYLLGLTNKATAYLIPSPGGQYPYYDEIKLAVPTNISGNFTLCIDVLPICKHNSHKTNMVHFAKSHEIVAQKRYHLVVGDEQKIPYNTMYGTESGEIYATLNPENRKNLTYVFGIEGKEIVVKNDAYHSIPSFGTQLESLADSCLYSALALNGTNIVARTSAPITKKVYATDPNHPFTTIEVGVSPTNFNERATAHQQQLYDYALTQQKSN